MCSSAADGSTCSITGGLSPGADRSVTRRLHSSDLLLDNSEEGFLGLMRQAGFEDPKRIGRGSMVLGYVAYSCYAGAVPLTQAPHLA